MSLIDRVNELLDYNPETGKFIWKKVTSNRAKVGGEAGAITPDGYNRITFDHAQYQAHRLAWLITYGCWPTDDLDHVNGNRADNRLCNLRAATRAQNIQNQHKANTRSSTGLLGAFKHKASGRYCSRIVVFGKTISLGYFNTAEEAHEAYVVKKRQVHEFCQV